MTYRQGDIILVNFPFTDLKRFKIRPALVVSGGTVDDTSDLVCIQITSKKYLGELYFRIPKKSVSPPLLLESGVRLHKFFTVERDAVIRRIGIMEPEMLAQIVSSIHLHVLPIPEKD